VSETEVVTNQANASIKAMSALALEIKTELGKTFHNASNMAHTTEETISKFED
jgi:hypothetical protein